MVLSLTTAINGSPSLCRLPCHKPVADATYRRNAIYKLLFCHSRKRNLSNLREWTNYRPIRLHRLLVTTPLSVGTDILWNMLFWLIVRHCINCKDCWVCYARVTLRSCNNCGDRTGWSEMRLDKVNNKWRRVAEEAFMAGFRRLLGTRLEQLQKVFKLPVPHSKFELNDFLYR